MNTVFKQFLVIFLSLAILIFAVSTTIYYIDAQSEKESIKTKESHKVQLKKEIITDDLHTVVSDLSFLAEQEELKDSFEENRLAKYILSNYLLFLEKKGFYDYISILNPDGNEVLRVNYNEGQPSPVFELLLQSKMGIDDFMETLVLDRGEFYMSPFDLNIEEGEIEKPFKPTIRFGTPIFDKEGQRQGIFLLNYLGKKIIHDFKTEIEETEGDLMLLNSDGYWLISSDQENEWGFMLENRKEKRFDTKFPDAWGRIAKEESGSYLDENHGLFTYATVYPHMESLKSNKGIIDNSADNEMDAKYYYWKIVSHVPVETLNAKSKKFLIRSFEINIVLYILLALGSWFLAHARVNRRRAIEEQKRLSTAIEHSVEGVIITNVKGNIQYVNPAFQEISGYSKEEIMGKNPSFVKSGLHDESFYKDMWECILAGKIWKSEYVNKRKDGSLYNSYSSIVPIKNEKGEIINFVGVSSDRTEQKQREEALAQKAEDLAHTNAELEQFASAVKKEMQSYAQLLQQSKGKAKTDADEYVQDAVDKISSIQNLINDLLAYSQVKAFSGSLKATDVGKVFDRVLLVMDAEIKKTGAKVTHDTLPVVIGDESQIVLLFQNLIQNAITYRGKEPPRIHISAKEMKISKTSGREKTDDIYIHEKEWLFSIADNGIGIDKQFHEEIFNQFQRLHDQEELPGTGVGLPICKRIIGRYGGKIWLESEIGKGTTFYFTIPH